MRKMSKFKEKIKRYSFFDLFPRTNYFAYVPLKSNEERLIEAVLALNYCSKSALKQVHEQLICEHGVEALSDKLECMYRIFIEHDNDFTKCVSGWDERTVAKCERHVRPELSKQPGWNHGVGTEKLERRDAERKLIRAIAARCG